MFIEIWKIAVIALISLLLVTVFFLGINPDQFLFLHDELLALNYNDALGGLYVRSFQDLNVDNTVILTLTLIDRLYYFIGHSLNLSLPILQKLLYFIKLFLLILLPYIGFTKFARATSSENNIHDSIIWLITFLYAFNTYTIIYWHGNAFQLSLLLCYALAPLSLFYFRKIINNPAPSLKLLMKESLVFLLMSFSVYLFAVFVIVLFTYYIARLITKPQIIKSSLLNLLKLAVLTIPLYAIFLPMISTIIFGSGTVNATGGETFSSLQGGVLYPMFFWFSWGIYNTWTPKNIFTFSDYYKSGIYLLSQLAIFLTIFWSTRKKIVNRNVIYFLAVLIIALIFVKGAQPPFELVYQTLIQRFPPFRVFRSPDSKFGFAIVLSVSFLLLYASSSIKRRIFIVIMTLIVSIQAFPLFTGIAIKGQNTSNSSDRVITIPENYTELAEYLKSNESQAEYVLPIPPVNFGHFIISPTEKHLGQDLIPKLIHNPFITPDEYSSMPLVTYKKIQQTFLNDLKGINEFPIEYFLIRHDLEFVSTQVDLDIQNNSQFEKVFQNENFDLYKNNSAAKLIEGTNVDSIEYTAVSPVEYRVKVSGIRENSALAFNANHNENWDLYVNTNTYDATDTSNKFTYFPNANSKLLEIENSIHNGYSNSWDITNGFITDQVTNNYYQANKNGIDASFTIYYQPQSRFYTLAMITTISTAIYATFILIKYDE